MELALGLESNESNIWREKGKLLVKQSELSQALDAYDTAISINPDIASYYKERGSVYEDMGLPDQARKDLLVFEDLRN